MGSASLNSTEQKGIFRELCHNPEPFYRPRWWIHPLVWSRTRDLEGECLISKGNLEFSCPLVLAKPWCASCGEGANPNLVRADLLWFILFNSRGPGPKKQFKTGVSEQRSRNVIKEKGLGSDFPAALCRLIPSSQISSHNLWSLTCPQTSQGSKEDTRSLPEAAVMSSNY